MKYKKRAVSGTPFVLFKWKIIKIVLCQEQQILSYRKASQNYKNQDSGGHGRGTLTYS